MCHCAARTSDAPAAIAVPLGLRLDFVSEMIDWIPPLQMRPR